MKMIYKIVLLIIVGISLISCRTTEIESFDTGTSYIYIDTPFLKDDLGRTTKERLKEYVYSFAFDVNEVSTHTFEIPVSIIGTPSNEDRQYKIEIVEDKTTATAEDWDENFISKVFIKKGEVVTPLKITVKRHSKLKEEARVIVLRVSNNENFSTGDKDLLEIKLNISEILNEPSWWKYYLKYFGPFYREIYIQWKEIYYLGADTKIDSNGILYHWNNMPTYFNSDWYPTLTMYMQILKQYFIDNEVYPDGDTSKPRILLPN